MGSRDRNDVKDRIGLKAELVKLRYAVKSLKAETWGEYTVKRHAHIKTPATGLLDFVDMICAFFSWLNFIVYDPLLEEDRISFSKGQIA